MLVVLLSFLAPATANDAPEPAPVAALEPSLQRARNWHRGTVGTGAVIVGGGVTLAAGYGLAALGALIAERNPVAGFVPAVLGLGLTYGGIGLVVGGTLAYGPMGAITAARLHRGPGKVFAMVPGVLAAGAAVYGTVGLLSTVAGGTVTGPRLAPYRAAFPVSWGLATVQLVINSVTRRRTRRRPPLAPAPRRPSARPEARRAGARRQARAAFLPRQRNCYAQPNR